MSNSKEGKKEKNRPLQNHSFITVFNNEWDFNDPI